MLPSRVPTPIRRGKVRERDWVLVSRGVHRPRFIDSPLVADLSGWQLLLPATGCFTHLTGALLRGWAVPPLPPDLPVFAAICRDHRRPRRRGLVVSRHPIPMEYDDVDGLRVARAPEILLAAARDLGLIDLVVLADAALHRGDCTLPQLQTAAQQRRRGAPSLRRVLSYADARSESPWESILRLLHQLCDVPVDSQYWIDGSIRADLHILGTRRLPEYDGAGHRDAAQQAKDLARDRRLRRLGWERYGYTSPVLLHNGLSVLRDADAALGRVHEPVRIRRWHAALAESLVTPAGTYRLQARWACRRTGDTA